jgi:hypothetical protein
MLSAYLIDVGTRCREESDNLFMALVRDCLKSIPKVSTAFIDIRTSIQKYTNYLLMSCIRGLMQNMSLACVCVRVQ